MRNVFLLAVVGGVLAAGGTIGYEVTSLGGNVYQYSYFLSGFSFADNEAFDIQFDNSLYQNLTGGVAGSGFDLLVLQPAGGPGDYFAEANTTNPPLTGPFTVDFTYLGVGLPGSQSYVLDQFDQNNIFQETVGSGTTTAVPEPGTIGLAGLGLMALAAGWAFRRQMQPDTTVVRLLRWRFGTPEPAARTVVD